MRSLGRVLTLIAVLWLWPTTIVGQSAALMDAFHRYEVLITEGRYEQAIPFADRCI